jgi:methionine biosynthesis protein MetW
MLDLGCASGALGAAIKDRQQVEVVGIELEPAHAAQAAERLDRVIQGDIEDVLADLAPSDLGRFDCIVAADVLEHLRDPWTALARAARLLKPGGVAIVSLPNVRHHAVIRTLLFGGTWPREDWGVFDRTHLRWFTRRDAVELMTKADLRVESITPSLWNGTGLAGGVKRVLARLGLEEFLASQYILTGVRMSGSRPGRDGQPEAYR